MKKHSKKFTGAFGKGKGKRLVRAIYSDPYRKREQLEVLKRR